MLVKMAKEISLKKVYFQHLQTYNKLQFGSKLKLVGGGLTAQLVLSHYYW